MGCAWLQRFREGCTSDCERESMTPGLLWWVLMIGAIVYFLKTWLELSQDVVRDVLEEKQFISFSLYGVVLYILWVAHGHPSMWIFCKGSGDTFAAWLDVFIYSGFVAFGYRVFHTIYCGIRCWPVRFGVPTAIIVALIVF